MAGDLQGVPTSLLPGILSRHGHCLRTGRGASAVRGGPEGPVLLGGRRAHHGHPGRGDGQQDNAAEVLPRAEGRAPAAQRRGRSRGSSVPLHQPRHPAGREHGHLADGTGQNPAATAHPSRLIPIRIRRRIPRFQIPASGAKCEHFRGPDELLDGLQLVSMAPHDGLDYV